MFGMNRISKLAKIGKNVKIGFNNIIGDNVVLSDNVTIGNNNRVYPCTKIYPCVTIGDNNIILENNLIGEHPSNIIYKGSKRLSEFKEKHHTGAIIGNNNYINSNVVIESGFENKTIIGNYNQIMYGCFIGDEAVLTEHVHLYPKVMVCGGVTMLPNSGAGVCSAIHQNKVVGSYAFIGMSTPVVKNIFPYYIYAGNKYNRLNSKRIDSEILKYTDDINILLDIYLKNTIHDFRKNLETLYIATLPTNINRTINEFVSNIA
jgi:acyl-[acyl carrier protein]--UDP-N-acetylglucosamine O-acyltransferase